MNKTMTYNTAHASLEEVKGMIMGEGINLTDSEFKKYLKEFTLERHYDILKRLLVEIRKVDTVGWEKVKSGWKLNLKDNEQQREGYMLFKVVSEISFTGSSEYNAIQTAEWKLGDADLKDMIIPFYVRSLLEFVKSQKR